MLRKMRKTEAEINCLQTGMTVNGDFFRDIKKAAEATFEKGTKMKIKIKIKTERFISSD